MPYSESDKLSDPLPRLPLDLAVQIRSVILETEKKLRSAMFSARGRIWSILESAALEIFAILLSPRQPEDYDDNDALRLAIESDVDTVLASIHQARRKAGFGRVDAMLYSQIRERLLQSDAAEQFETKWWEAQAKVEPTSGSGAPSASGPTPRNRRTPPTQTARRIEEFRRRIEAAGRLVSVRDMITFCGYSDYTMFQRVQREAEDASQESREVVERMLACPSPQEFWRIVEANRKKMKART